MGTRHEPTILDLLDRADSLLAGVDLDAADASSRRKAKIRNRNARLTLNEIRRRIERTGEETK